MGPLATLFGYYASKRDPEDLKMGRESPEEEQRTMELRRKLGASDPGGPIRLDEPMALPAIPPSHTALRGGMYEPPGGPGRRDLPFRPEEQPVNEPPGRSPLAAMFRGPR